MATLHPARLRTEYLENPLGLDLPKPRLFWRLESETNGARQTAYQILAATSPDLLSEGRADLWDTGRIESSVSAHLPYEGTPLNSLQTAWWTVRAWDENGAPSDWAAPAFWEAGLMSETDWNASEWIEDLPLGGPRTSAPAPFFRKEFSLEKPVAKARLVATALGLYEFHLNGRRVGEDYLTPGWTHYQKRVQYQVYDVTAELQTGANAMGAILGDGWYCGNVEWRGRQMYGEQPRLRAQLHVEYVDGSREILGTDSDWKASFGPILESDLLMGESYDARHELGAWDEPGYDDSAWRGVKTWHGEVGPLVGMRGPTVRTTQVLGPVSEPTVIHTWPKPEYLYDLGQNMVGRVRLRVKGQAGQTVRLRYGEVLDEKGRLYTANLRTARQTDYYTLKGDPEGEIWQSHFTFHGFRYVELTGIEDPGPHAVTGLVMHSDTERTGDFECSDELVNQLQRNIDWGWRGNSVDIPTDCPQRDERLGWTGDAQVFVRTAAFNRGVAGFFTKWANDVRDAQKPSGSVPAVCPDSSSLESLDGNGGPAWADAAIICPWTIYLCYGDTGLLAEHYEDFRAFVEYLEGASIGLIRSHPDWKGFHGFGDWLSTNAVTPNDLIGTAFFAYSARLLSKIAAILAKEEDASRFSNLADRVREAFQNRFVTPDGQIVGQTQTAYILALHFDLLPEGQRPAVAQALVDDIGRRGWKLSTGFVGTPYIAHVLCDHGRPDVAYRLLFQKDWPSWLYAVTKGATTIWERWDGWTHDKGFQDVSMNSFNHYAYGAIGDWLYRRVAGIDVDESRPGYRHVILRPQPGEGLTHASAWIEALPGRVESSWRLEGDTFVWDVLVPPNSTATAVVPLTEGTQRVEAPAEAIETAPGTFELPSGRYTFRRLPA